MEKICLPEQNLAPLQDGKTKENINKTNNQKKENSDSNQKCQGSKTSSLVGKKNNEKDYNTKALELYNKITKEDLQKLCDQLSAFNMRIKAARDVIRLRDELPL